MKRSMMATIMVALMVVSLCSVFTSSTATHVDLAPSGLVEFYQTAGSDPTSRDGSRAFNDTEHMGRATTPPTIDGLISDGEWDDAAVYDIGVGGRKVTYMVMFDSTINL